MVDGWLREADRFGLARTRAIRPPLAASCARAQAVSRPVAYA